MSRAALKVESERSGRFSHALADVGMARSVATDAVRIALPPQMPLHERLIQTTSRVAGLSTLAAGYGLTFLLLTR